MQNFIYNWKYDFTRIMAVGTLSDTCCLINQFEYIYQSELNDAGSQQYSALTLP